MGSAGAILALIFLRSVGIVGHRKDQDARSDTTIRDEEATTVPSVRTGQRFHDYSEY